MKITRNTSEQLIVENNPIWLAVFVSSFAAIFLIVGMFTLQSDLTVGIAFIIGSLVIGVGFNLAFIRRTQLILDHPRNLVELRRRSLLGYKRRIWDREHLSAAIVQTSQSSDSNTYRAALVFDGGMDAGTYPVTLVYSSGSGADHAADAVNNWLAASLDSQPATT